MASQVEGTARTRAWKHREDLIREMQMAFPVWSGGAMGEPGQDKAFKKDHLEPLGSFTTRSEK